jgi:hypothetical protein
MAQCIRQQELRQATNHALARIQALARQQLELLQSGDDKNFASLDRELEMAFGEKERSFGALRAHREEHGC